MYMCASLRHEAVGPARRDMYVCISQTIQCVFFETCSKKHAGGWLTGFWLSPYKASKSSSQPGGVPPSAAGLRWIAKKRSVSPKQSK